MSHGIVLDTNYTSFSDDEKLNYGLKIALSRLQTELNRAWYQEPKDFAPKGPETLYKSTLPSYNDLSSYYLIDPYCKVNGVDNVPMITDVTVADILDNGNNQSGWEFSNISTDARDNSTNILDISQPLSGVSKKMFTRYRYWENGLTGTKSDTDGSIVTGSNFTNSGTTPDTKEPENTILSYVNGSLSSTRTWKAYDDNFGEDGPENTFFTKLTTYSSPIKIISPDKINTNDYTDIKQAHPFIELYLQVPTISTRQSADTVNSSASGNTNGTDNIGFFNPIMKQSLGDVEGFKYVIRGWAGDQARWQPLNIETGVINNQNILYFLNNPGFILCYGVKNIDEGFYLSYKYPPVISFLKYTGETFADGIITQDISDNIPPPEVSNVKDLYIDTTNNLIYRLDQSGNEKSWVSVGGSGGASSSATGDASGNFIIDISGNVGIKTTDPQYELDVSGTIRATGDVQGANITNLDANITNLGANITNLDKVTSALRMGNEDSLVYNYVDGNELSKLSSDLLDIGVKQEVLYDLSGGLSTTNTGYKWLSIHLHKDSSNDYYLSGIKYSETVNNRIQHIQLENILRDNRLLNDEKITSLFNPASNEVVGFATVGMYGNKYVGDLKQQWDAINNDWFRNPVTTSLSYASMRSNRHGCAYDFNTNQGMVIDADDVDDDLRIMIGIYVENKNTDKSKVDGAMVIGKNYLTQYKPPVNGMLIEGNVGIGKTNPTTALDVSGNTTLGGTLDVSGNTTLGGDVGIGGTLQPLDGTLDVSGNTTVGGTLDVSGNTTLGGDVGIGGTLQPLDGTLDVSGNTTVGGTLDVSGNTTVGGTLDVSGSVSFTGGTQTMNNVDINGGSIDNTAIGSSTRSSGKFTTLDVSGTITTNTLEHPDNADYNVLSSWVLRNVLGTVISNYGNSSTSVPSEGHQSISLNKDGTIVAVGIPNYSIYDLSNSSTLNPPESDRSYSSTYDNDAPGVRYARSKLDSGDAWLSDRNTLGTEQWMRIDLTTRQYVTGVVTQGRYLNSVWTTTLRVEYSDDDVNYYDVDNGKIYTANTDQNTKVTNTFTTPVLARYIRIYPLTSGSTNGYYGMRAGVTVANVTGSNKGTVRVYQYNGISWGQLGGDTDLDGLATGEKFGMSVSLSSDGSIVAVGAPGNQTSSKGTVRVYEYQSTNNTWIRKGNNDSDMEGDVVTYSQVDYGDRAGSSVSLSSDGSIVAVGCPIHNGGKGVARVYSYSGSSWNQIGTDLTGNTQGLSGDRAGSSVSLSSDGTVVAVGWYGKGTVYIYEYNGSSWVQKGTNNLYSGDSAGSSVSLSNNGNIVAVGVPYHDSGYIYSDNKGTVRVYEYNGSSWVQKGNDLDGSSDDHAGNSVALNGDGTIVAVGTNNNKTFVYQYNGSSWQLLGQTLTGQYSVALSDAGYTVAVVRYIDDAITGRVYKIGYQSVEMNSILESNNDIIVHHNIGIGSSIPRARLDVSGNTILDGTLDVSGNTTVGGTLDVSGNTTVGGTLDVSGTITGSSIENTAIGSSTRSSGKFTTLETNSVDINGGSIDNTAIGSSTRSSGKFTTLETNDKAQMYGYVGIGTNPGYPLEVKSYRHRTLNHMWLYNYAYYDSTSFSVYWENATATDISIYSHSGIYSHGGYNAPSDSRIKENICNVPDDLSLDKLRNIEVKYYEYKDKIRKGTDKTIGFIAQQVKEIMPMAVKEITEGIPILKLLTNFTWETIIDESNNKYKLVTNELQDSSGVKYTFFVGNDISNNNIETKYITVNHDNCFIFDNSWNYVFCYEKEVDDFNSLDKQKLFALNFSATQEIDRIQQQEIIKVQTLQTDLSNANTTIQQQAAKIQNLETQIVDILTRLSNLENTSSS